VKVAAYQAPLLRSGSLEAVDLIRTRVEWCESQGVVILCCPEAILGGLADNVAEPGNFAIDTRGDQLARALAPLASHTVTTIVGFTEVAGTGRLYNTAAVFHKGAVLGLYRKLYPAINRSVYDAGDRMPVFQVGRLTFGIVICNDSNYPEPARVMASQGATALFIPTNNGLPQEKADVAARARNVDIALAMANNVCVIRADVAGRTAGLVSFGSSEIVDPQGNVLQAAHPLMEELIVADLEVSAPVSMAMR
jgi:predicted amidohydrolase